MRFLTDSEWADVRQEVWLHVDPDKTIAEGVLRARPLKTRFISHHWHPDEYSFWQRMASNSGDRRIIAVGCDRDPAPKNWWPPNVPRAVEFTMDDAYPIYRGELLLHQYDHLSFYDCFDCFVVISPGGGWLSYLNNRADIGFLSATSEDALATLQALTSEILLDLEDLQRPKSWYHLDADPATLAANYSFSLD